MSGSRIRACSDEPATAGAILEAAGVIARGGVVAHPTETLYGLAVDPWNDRAVDRLARLKGREAGRGFILIASERGQVDAIVEAGSGAWKRLAGRFWPGPLTLILPAGPAAPRGVLGDTGGLAIRVTPDPIARRLVAAVARPVTSTSANRGGEPPARTAEELDEIFGAGVDLILDGGLRKSGSPSTLVDLLSPAGRILREGAIPRDLIERALAGD